MITPRHFAAVSGTVALETTRVIGRSARVIWACVRAAPRLRGGELGRALVTFGYRSLPLIIVVGIVIGATVVAQTAFYANQFGARSVLGWASGYAVLWEFGPLVLGLMLAARVGARNAAELALLKLRGVLEGLSATGLDPHELILAPRLFAIVISSFSLAAVTFALALVFETVAAKVLLELPPRVFVNALSNLLSFHDVLGGVLKSVTFGLGVALCSTMAGLSAGAGAKGVGQAAAKAVVNSSAVIFALDLLLTPLFARVLGS